ncbi:MAG TPA: hypothetical protein VK992_03665 [Candidatus Caenarcaniphilales bacterium]|nr:hypothetical protein [Candidatus Caenarcaniphilales bacterium]
MLGRDEEAVIEADAYIDALLAAHARVPALLPDDDRLPVGDVRWAIDLLESGLPRFHPSFRFEEDLAARLLAAATVQPRERSAPAGDLIQLSLATPVTALQAQGPDRRLLLGGAIASGVSLAGAAMLVRAAQRLGRVRSRIEWLS